MKKIMESAVMRILDKGILILLCILCVLRGNVGMGEIFGLLIVVTVSALCEYFNKKFTCWLCLALVIASMFSNSIFVFVPVIAYDCFCNKQRVIKYSFICSLLAGLVREFNLTYIIVVLVSILAVWLCIRSERDRKVQEKYHVMQDEAKEKSMKLEHKNKELLDKQDYEVRLATLGERNRIAREIHDNVGHLLTRGILQVGALQVIYSDNEDMRENLTELKATLDDAMDSVRKSVHNLHDESVDLRMNLCMLIDEFDFCTVKLNYDAENVPKELRYCFIAIVKEALSNIAKHSNATHAEVSLFEHPGLYQLVIEDNGTENKTAHEDSSGIGLQNMKDRIDAFGGVFRTSCSQGFKIFISVPRS